MKMQPRVVWRVVCALALLTPALAASPATPIEQRLISAKALEYVGVPYAGAYTSAHLKRTLSTDQAERLYQRVTTFWNAFPSAVKPIRSGRGQGYVWIVPRTPGLYAFNYYTLGSGTVDSYSCNLKP